MTHKYIVVQADDDELDYPYLGFYDSIETRPRVIEAKSRPAAARKYAKDYGVEDDKGVYVFELLDDEGSAFDVGTAPTIKEHVRSEDA